MGLKNISKVAEKIKYNGVERNVAPGAVIDVRDFNIQNHEVLAVEDILSNKHRDSEDKKIFEYVQTIGNMSDAQINAEIKRLNEELEGAREESLAKDKDVEDQAKKIVELQNESEVLKNKIEKLEEALEKAKSKNKG